MKKENITTILKEMACEERAARTAGFYKTGEGQYAEKSTFIGITVPELRRVAKEHFRLPLKEIHKLLHSKIHEEKVIALMMLRLQFEKGDEAERQKIFEYYCDNTLFISNWDLVDGSAPFIVGTFLLNKDKSILYKWIKSSSLWERRIAIVATQMFIRNELYDDTFALAQLLLNDSEDLMHKATGWMLREVGKKNRKALESFLKKHRQSMPRTMLRYAIEHFTPEQRAQYLSK